MAIYIICLFSLVVWVQALAILEAFAVRVGQTQQVGQGKNDAK